MGFIFWCIKIGICFALWFFLGDMAFRMAKNLLGNDKFKNEEEANTAFIWLGAVGFGFVVFFQLGYWGWDVIKYCLGIPEKKKDEKSQQ